MRLRPHVGARIWGHSLVLHVGQSLVFRDGLFKKLFQSRSSQDREITVDDAIIDTTVLQTDFAGRDAVVVISWIEESFER